MKSFLSENCLAYVQLSLGLVFCNIKSQQLSFDSLGNRFALLIGYRKGYMLYTYL